MLSWILCLHKWEDGMWKFRTSGLSSPRLEALKLSRLVFDFQGFFDKASQARLSMKPPKNKDPLDKKNHKRQGTTSCAAVMLRVEAAAKSTATMTLAAGIGVPAIG